ncbi:MAG: arylformamidase [Parcubacteria group bacterium Gr01-1014_38]|nr:MAG: arylformamidase [Parcubacteria group bacterium Gr01-1014_38]
MRILDISRVLNERSATYPLNPTYERTILRDVPDAPSSLSRIILGTHTGTHVDAPRHVQKDGAGIDHVPLERLVGSAVVLDLTDVADTITARDLEKRRVPKGHIVLIQTKNSAADPGVFDERFVACDESAAQFLANLPVLAVGIDGPSIKKFQVRDRTHHLLLERGIPVIEGLDLSAVPVDHYTFVCLPLVLAGADGAPARAILLRE